MVTAGEAKGWGFFLDATSLEQIRKLATGLPRGIPGRWTHGPDQGDGLGTFLGRWVPDSIRIEGAALVGDFAFSGIAHKTIPAGLSVSAAEYLMDLAESDPDEFGTSLVIEYTAEEVEINGETVMAARVSQVRRGDFVADPAANPDGLFATEADLHTILSGAESKLGRRCVVACLSRYMGATMASDDTETDEDEKDKDDDEMPASFKSRLGALLESSAEMSADEILAQVQALLMEDDEDDEPKADPEKEEADMSQVNLAAQVATLTGVVAALRAAEKVRQVTAAAKYLEGLKTKAIACQSPIPETDLRQVTASFASGDDATARLLGDAFLSRSKALGAGSFTTGSGGKVIKLGALTGDADETYKAEMASFRERHNLTKGA